MEMDSITRSAAALSALPNPGFQARTKFRLISIRPTFLFPVRFHGYRRFHSSAVTNYKQYDSAYLDFQGYAKPSRLLQATEPKVSLENLQETNFTSLSDGGSQSLFKVKLQTSNAYGSGLSDHNAGILLCLIDTNGDSILQRIPVLLRSESSDESNKLHFQRGSIDEIIFRGPKLDAIEALWISLEWGQWRLGGVSLTVVSATQHSTQEHENNCDDSHISALQYEFEVDEILIGEGCDAAMVELRPTVVSELSGADPRDLLTKTPLDSTTTSSAKSFEDNMREYTDLKLSLLSYDAALIFIGTIVANLSAGENEALAFLFGGIGGFLYLLLIQRSVDGLEVLGTVSGQKGRANRLFGGFKGPITGLALGLGLTSLGLKYLSGDVSVAFSSKELLSGMVGFLACKVAVVLAAFRPMSIGLKETETGTENENEK